MMEASNFTINVDELSQNLDEFQGRLKYAVQMYASTKANELEALMKANRKWTDRTGMAKARLNASTSEPDENTIRITLAHGVEYGIWLELANEKNFAIIAPTLSQQGPRVIEGLNDLMNEIKL